VLKVTAPSGINLQKIDRRDHTVPDVRTSPAFPQKSLRRFTGASALRAPAGTRQARRGHRMARNLGLPRL